MFQGNISNIDTLFDSFTTSFEGTTPGLYHMLNNNGEIVQVGVDKDLLPLKVLATQICCAYAMYIFGKFACKTNIQITSFAIPISLIVPITISGLFGMCDVKNQAMTR